jgi:beta-phosphoglucomutase family hydrolase
MAQPEPPTVHWPDYDGVLLDLDGVITDTAEIHASCWKRMFDAYLKERAERLGEEFVPFDAASDYRTYVDGRPRLDGVRTFLESRNIELPEGSPDDPPDAETIHALGGRKNALVQEEIDAGGVKVYDASVEYVKALRDAGVALAIVTSSANCDPILRSVGLLDLFPTRIDGNVIRERGLAGKPAPDSFIAGAEALRIPPIRLVVVEDALSGVEAGRNGGFGLVVGVARHGNAADLRSHGADVVVTDLSEMNPPPPGGCAG